MNLASIAATGYPGLYEVRSNVTAGRIARVFFTVSGRTMVLLHGFIKKELDPCVDAPETTLALEQERQILSVGFGLDLQETGEALLVEEAGGEGAGRCETADGIVGVRGRSRAVAIARA